MAANRLVGGKTWFVPTSLLLAAMLLAEFAAAQATWSNLDGPPVGAWGGVFDARRGRFVRFPLANGSDVWEYDNHAWNRLPGGLPPFGAPAARSDYGSVFDANTGHVLLYGGRQTSTFGDMWSWDGLSWAQVPGTLGPGRRRTPAMAYDPAQQAVILYGGADGTTLLSDTWKYDGVSWTQLQAAGAQAAEAPCMTYEGAAGRLVLLSNSLWSWNGTTWALVNGSVNTSDTTRLCYDERLQRVLAYSADSLAASTVRQLNGSTWTVTFTGSAPAFRGVWYYDPRRQRTMLASTEGLGDLFSFDGAVFTREPVPRLSSRASQVFVDDPAGGGALLFGGTIGGATDETFRWDGHAWQQLAPLASPTPRTGAAGAHDTASGVALMFGGSQPPIGTTPGRIRGDLWGFNGSTWTLLAPEGLGPSERLLAGMTFDSTRNRAVLFGGLGLTGPLQDTWEWDGVNWLSTTPAQRPPAAVSPGIAFDPVRDRTVLYLGARVPPETWEWDGVNWALQPGVGAAVPSAATSMAFDVGAGKISLIASAQGSGLWDYDGVAWTQRATTNDYDVGVTPRLIFDSTRQRLLIHNSGSVQELQDVPATTASYGAGCGAPPSMLMVRDQPRLGTPGFGLDAAFVGGAPVLFGLGGVAGNLPLGNGCSLLLGSLLLTQFAICDAPGLASWTLPVPNSPSLLGGVVFAQALAAVPSAPGGFAMTQGLQFTVGQ